MFPMQNPMATPAAEGQRVAAAELMTAQLRRAMDIGASLGEVEARFAALQEAYEKNTELLLDYQELYGDPENTGEYPELKSTLEEARSVRKARQRNEQPSETVE